MTSATSASARPASSTAALRGIGWMALTGVLFVGVTAIVRHLGTDMNPVQAAFVRYAFGLVLLGPILLRLFKRVPFTGLGFSRGTKLHALRGLVHGAAVMLWFYAMARIPIAQVTALGFTAPIFTTIGAALFLGEKLHARRIGAVIAGFGGALIILRPGFVAIDPGALAQLTAAPLFAVSFLLAKKLTATESPTAIVAWLSIFVTLALLGPALAVWRTPTWEELFWLFMTAVLATLGHYTLTRAFNATEITVTQPISFLQLVWATLLGLYAFGEEPSLWTWVGGFVIVASATYIAYRETRTKGRAEPKAAPT